MNYAKIFIKGLASEPQHLEAYYKRELKKALKKDYTEAEFFDGFSKLLEQVEQKLDENYFNDLSQINKGLLALEQGRFKYPDNGLSDEENYKITKNSLLTDHKKQAEEFRQSIRIPLHLIFGNTYGYRGFLDRTYFNNSKKVLQILKISSTINKLETLIDSVELKKENSFEDFFKNVTPEQLEQIKDLIKPLTGKQLAIFIDLAISEFEILSFQPNSKTGLSQKDFVTIQGKKYGAVHKSQDHNYKVTETKNEKEPLREQLKTILKKSR